jgi:hypothetical protein
MASGVARTCCVKRAERSFVVSMMVIVRVGRGGVGGGEVAAGDRQLTCLLSGSCPVDGSGSGSYGGPRSSTRRPCWGTGLARWVVGSFSASLAAFVVASRL